MANEQNSRIALPAVVDLDAVHGIRDRLLDALDAGPVTLDAGAVERIATNALLMLLAAATTARRNGFAFLVENVSVPMRAAIDRLGLHPHLVGIVRE